MVCCRATGRRREKGILQCVDTVLTLKDIHSHQNLNRRHSSYHSCNALSVDQQLNMTGKETDQASRLARAAEELVKAAKIETEAVNNDLQQQAVDHLAGMAKDISAFKADVNNKVNTSNQHVAALAGKVDVIAANVAALTDEMKKLNQSMHARSKRMHIVEALSLLTHIDDFQYNEISSDNNRSSQKYAKDLIKRVLLSFSKDRGYYVDNLSLPVYYHTAAEEEEKKKKEMQNKLVDEMHSILGMKPALREASNGRLCIWYD